MALRRSGVIAGVALLALAGGSDFGQLRAGEAADAKSERVQLGVMLQGDGPCPGAAPGSGDEGVCLISLSPDGAAYRAGLRAGDRVLQFGQTRVTQASVLPAALQTLRVGDSVEVTYVRGGDKRQTTVKFEAADRAGARALVTAATPSDVCDETLNVGTTLRVPYRKQPLALDRQAVEELLDGKSAAIELQGEVLTIAFRAEGGSAHVMGSIQCALDCVENSNLWALQLQMAQWPQTFLSAQLLATANPSRALVPERPTGEARFNFRGNAAPPPPAIAQPLRGTLTNAEVPSRFLQAPKQVTVYLPSGKRTGALPALYMTDGTSVADFAPIVEALIVAGRIRPIAIVGEHAGITAIDPSQPYDPRQDQRSREYLAGVDPVVFERHMRFFIEELLPWAEKQYGLSIARRDRAAMGYSNGGAFVASLGLRHPQVFFTVMPFSPAGSPFGSSETAADPAQMPRFLFAAGELESPFLANARANSAWLKARGVANNLRAYWSGHDILQWQQALADYLPEVFPLVADSSSRKKQKTRRGGGFFAD